MDCRQKIFFDTDIGDDIDDALALYMAMEMGLDIVGITTVFRNTQERARLTKKLLRAYGRGYEHVPVYPGYGEEPSHIPEYSEDLERQEYTPDGGTAEQAVDFLLSCCRKYGKDLTLIAIGPFTNVARAIQKDPQALNGIGRVVIMGGAYYRQYADWNVMCDVEGADVMFRNLSNLECLGADVTHQLGLAEEDTRKLMEDPGGSPARQMIRSLLNGWDKIRPPAYPLTLHDPLAVYYAAHPQVCQMEQASVVVLTEGYGKGLTLNMDSYRKAAFNPAWQSLDTRRKQSVAREVDRQQLIQAFLELFA